MTIYLIAGKRIDSEDPEFESIIASVHTAKNRPLCLCRHPGIEMYVAKVEGHYIIKRMPNSGATHSPSCESYEPPAELSGLGQVIGTAIEEDQSGGTTLLKLDFSLSKSGSRNMPVPSAKESDSVSSKGNKLTLRGTLHYLWEQARFNHWSPNMLHKRNWFVIRKHLLGAVENKTTKGMDLSSVLFIPERFNLEEKDAIAKRRQAQIMRVATPHKGARQLMIAIAEVNGIEKSRYGMKIIAKHLPDLQFQLSDDLHARLIRRFDSELSLWNTQTGSHLMMIATFGMSVVGVATLEEVALMVVNENWIPYENVYDFLLIEQLTLKNRHFVKGLRYNMPSSKPLAAVVLTDMPTPHALYITPIGASTEFADEQDKLINESKMPSLVWNTTSGGMPALPTVPEQISFDHTIRESEE
jgi:hypothetical protein